MEIVCDTNIWYGLASGSVTKPEGALGHTRVSLVELVQTRHGQTNLHLLRGACQKLTQDSAFGYHLQPLAHIADVLGVPVPSKEVNSSLKAYGDKVLFVQGIGMGDSIDSTREAEFLTLIEAERQPLFDMEQAYSMVRQGSVRVSKRTVNRTAHLSETKRIIAQAIGRKVGLQVAEGDLDYRQIELFLHTFDLLRYSLGHSGRTMKANDFGDLLNLAYVQPETTYWTLDRPWLSLVRHSGMGGYLYSPPLMT